MSTKWQGLYIAYKRALWLVVKLRNEKYRYISSDICYCRYSSAIAHSHYIVYIYIYIRMSDSFIFSKYNDGNGPLRRATWLPAAVPSMQVSAIDRATVAFSSGNWTVEDDESYTMCLKYDRDRREIEDVMSIER